MSIPLFPPGSYEAITVGLGLILGPGSVLHLIDTASRRGEEGSAVLRDLYNHLGSVITDYFNALQANRNNDLIQTVMILQQTLHALLPTRAPKPPKGRALSDALSRLVPDDPPPEPDYNDYAYGMSSGKFKTKRITRAKPKPKPKRKGGKKKVKIARRK